MIGTTRTLPALTIATFTVLLLSACTADGPELPTSSPDDGSGAAAGMGVVTIRVHDQADPTLQEVHVTFSSLAVHPVEGDWVMLEPTGEDVDLLAHVGPDNAVTVTTGLVPEGEYDSARATVAAVRVVLADGTSTDVPLPPEGYPVATAVSFTVSEGGEVIVNLHFPVEGSLQPVDGGFSYAPSVEASVVYSD
jgi:hypothetical protein